MADRFINGNKTLLSSGNLVLEFLSFAAIGLIALFVDMAALWFALTGLGLDLYLGRLFSYVIAATFTWWLNRIFTFKGVSQSGTVRQWTKFIAANTVGGIVNFATYTAIITLASSFTPVFLQPLLSLLPYGAAATGSLAGLMFNFTASKFLVFRR